MLQWEQWKRPLAMAIRDTMNGAPTTASLPQHGVGFTTMTKSPTLISLFMLNPLGDSHAHSSPNFFANLFAFSASITLASSKLLMQAQRFLFRARS